MSKTLNEVSRDAAELSVSDRLKLARMLLEISEQESEPLGDLQAAWDEEIERRLQELRSGKVKGVPLEKVREKIEKRFRL